MTSEILLSVRSRDFTTFQELTLDVPAFFGSYHLCRPERPDILIWHACSIEGIEAFADLWNLGEIRLELAPAVSYRVDLEFPPHQRARSQEIFERPTGETVWVPFVIVEGYKGTHGDIREGRFV